MTDSKYFTTTKKGEIFELKSELNNDKKEKKKEAVKKVNFYNNQLEPFDRRDPSLIFQLAHEPGDRFDDGGQRRLSPFP